jgi:hypothetical protein
MSWPGQSTNETCLQSTNISSRTITEKRACTVLEEYQVRSDFALTLWAVIFHYIQAFHKLRCLHEHSLPSDNNLVEDSWHCCTCRSESNFIECEMVL